MNTEAPEPRAIGRKAVTVPLAAVMIAAILTVIHFVADDGPARPQVPTEESVPVTEVPVASGADLTGDGEVWDGPQHTAWPKPARAVVTAGQPDAIVPVTVAALSGGPTDVDVAVKTRAASERLGLTGPMFAASGVDGEGEVELTFRYAEFADIYGGDWGSRLRLVQLPECAARTPWRAKCQGGEWLPTENRAADGTVTATVALSSGESVFGLTAEEESESGDYKATDLEPAGEWTAGGNSGGFSYKYPIGGPPTEGPQPTIDLTYASQTIDGRTSGANNQARWAGDGWNISSDYVERSYQTCTDDRDKRDGETPNNADKKTHDRCWYSDNATVSLNGTNATLVKDDDTGRWHTDNNWRIERLTDSALDGYDDNGEYWKVTTEDGVQYFFGREPATSKSTWTLPVFGNHPGEPCHKSAFKDSSCKQAWRWMLDKVVDPSGNMSRYFYKTETGHYGAADDADNRASYVRNGWLDRIDYGLHTADPDVAATARISFTAEDRCFADPCWKDDDKTKPETENWPDVPWDTQCDKAPCTYTKVPVFFTQKRLAEVSTSVRTGTEFVKVDTWTVEHESRKPGDNTTPILWLKSITRTGHHGSDESMPTIRFTPVGMDNRVDTLDGIDPLHRFRIGNIRTESGADIHVTYSDPECDRNGTMPDKPEDNAMRCFPSWWIPDNHETEILGWFHKYVVTEITEIDNTGGSVPVSTRYEYHLDGGGTEQLWAYDTSEFTKKKHRTYSEWRGYPRVTTLVGDPDQGAPPLTTEERYYRGMDGERLPDDQTRSASVVDSQGDTVIDHAALAGSVFESLVYNGDELFSSDANRYWIRQTAERSFDGMTYRTHLTGVSDSVSRSWLAADSWRTTRVLTEYDEEGNPVQAGDLGDLAVAGDERCTRTWYAQSDTAWIRSAVAREETVGVACDVTPDRPEDVLGDTRTYYDGNSDWAATPTRGLSTKVETLDGWSDGPIYATQSQTRYDAMGRTVAQVDGLGHTTTTEFVPSGAGPVDHSIVTNPLGHVVTTYQHPEWAEPYKIVDASGVVTQLTYDPFGRITGVWKDGRDPASQPANMKFGYLVRSDGPLAITTEELTPGGGYTTEIQLLDSLYRPRQTQTSSVDGGRLLTETGYDDRGQDLYESGPNFNADAPSTDLMTVSPGEDMSRTVNTYDGLGRTTAEGWWSKNIEWWRTTTSYGGNPDAWQVSVTPPAGETATTRLTNARDELIELREHHGPTPDSDYDATTYTYHANGEYTSVTNEAGQSWTFEYDLRGRRIAAVDPDGGATVTEYDNADREIAVTDSRGIRVETDYDPLGREVAVRHGDTVLAELAYDTSLLPDGTTARGHLSKSTAWVDGHAFIQEINKYDFGYRPTQTRAVVPAAPGMDGLSGEYWGTTTYYPEGSIHRMGLPALGGLEREIVAHEYDELGNPVRVVGTMYPSGQVTAYVDDATYSPYGELAQRELGNGHEAQVYHSYQYQDGTRRLERFSFDRDATVTNVASSTYWYDATGNILSIADIPAGQEEAADIQCFQYDYLRRMTQAWTQANAWCADTVGADVVGGTQPYWNSYELDSAGNRLSYSFGQAAERSTAQYRYGQGHRLTSVTYPDRTDQFEYDAAGNTVLREVAGNRQELTWDVRGRLESITESGDLTRMYYTTDGQRLARIDADGAATLFLAGHEVTRDAGDGSVSAVRYYDHGDETIASRNSRELTWLGSDHQSTTQWSVNATTMVSVVQRQDPYGAKRGAQQQFLGQRGFVGSITDPTGLSHMGARQYDSATGRFISVDPKIDYEDPQRMHAYAYSNNSPITFSDPTGEAFSVAKLAKWSGNVSAVAGTVALVAAVIPGAQPVAAAAGAIAVGAAAVSTAAHLTTTIRSARSGNSSAAWRSGGDAAWAAAGMIPGAGGIRAGIRAGRAAMQGGRTLRSVRSSLNSTSDALFNSRRTVRNLTSRLESATMSTRSALPNLRHMGFIKRNWTRFTNPTGFQNYRRLESQLASAQRGLAAARERAASMLARARAAAEARRVRWNAWDRASHAHTVINWPSYWLPRSNPSKNYNKPRPRSKPKPFPKNVCHGNYCLW